MKTLIARKATLAFAVLTVVLSVGAVNCSAQYHDMGPGEPSGNCGPDECPPQPTFSIVRPIRADASATSKVIISHNGRDALVVLDASRSVSPVVQGAGDNWFPDLELDIWYSWYVAGTGEDDSFVVEFYSPRPVATVTLPLGKHAIILEVSSYFSSFDFSAGDAVTVEVITAAQAAQRLAAIVNSAIPHPRPLTASVEAATAAFDRGDSSAGVNQLRAFQNKIRAQIAPLNVALANELVASSEQIIKAASGR